MSIADFIEPAIKDYATQATATYSAPIDTSKFTGRQFVAGEDPLQTQAINLATQGIGGFQPFLTSKFRVLLMQFFDKVFNLLLLPFCFFHVIIV